MYVALGFEYEPVVGKYKVDTLQSATYLLNPLVSNYSNIVVKKPDLLLYDVTTEILPDGEIKLFGRKFGTVQPFIYKGDKESLEENFIIVKHTKLEIAKMLTERSAKKKK